jgi:carbamoyl-phosphate synthase small subunit
MPKESPMPNAQTACLALADGTLFYGRGFGATGETVAELVLQHRDDRLSGDHDRPVLCRAGRDLHLSHVGNVGVTPEDDETAEPVAAGMVVKWDPTEPSNWRAAGRSDRLAAAAWAGSASAASTPAA